MAGVVVERGQVGQGFGRSDAVVARVAPQGQCALEHDARGRGLAGGAMATSELRIELGDLQRQLLLFALREFGLRTHGVDACVLGAEHAQRATPVGR